MKKNILFYVSFVMLFAIEAFAQKTSNGIVKESNRGREVVSRLETGANNPRNIEGDFITF